MMARKSTYKELNKRIKELEKEALEHKHAEEKLRESEATLRSIFRAAPTGIGLVCDRVIKQANDRLCEILGYSQEELLGKSARMVYPTDEDFEYVGSEKYAQIYERGTGIVETRLQRKDGKVIDVLLSSALIGPNDLSMDVTFTVLDITSRNKTEKVLQESEERYRSLFKNNHAVMLLIDPENADIVDANPAAISFYGWSHEELTGKKITNINMLTEEQVFQETEKAKTEQRRKFYFKHCLASKEIRDVEVYSGLIMLHGRELLYSIIHDITDRKQAEEELQKARDDLEQRVKERTAELAESNEKLKKEIIERKQMEGALRESENRFRNLVESSPVGICIIQQNQIVYQNPRLKRLLGPLPKRFENHVLDYLHPDDVEKCKEVYRQITSGRNQTSEVDFRFYPPGKKNSKFSLCWVQCRASLINYQGEDAILLNMMDITRVKEIEHLLTIKQKMNSLGHVAAGIAHEIRNPLTGINSYLYTLEDLCDSEIIEGDQIEMIKQIISQFKLASDKIEAVIKRVLDFSRPNLPKMDLIDLNQCIEETLNLSAITLRKNNIKIEKSLEPDLPQCYGDSHLIEQILLNLINNAARAMEKNQKAKRIQIDSFRKKKSLYIQISDSGPGIPKELKDHIFNPFFTTSPDGTGIGLSIAQRII
ncbi:MAG: PAS domain S-box protein [Desulfobacteraceae bacterium]|nr:MAG: PAS domain S-box protein [Desulfobacteraceae bacterium]